jgi:hypothetical protein
MVAKLSKTTPLIRLEWGAVKAENAGVFSRLLNVRSDFARVAEI